MVWSKRGSVRVRGRPGTVRSLAAASAADAGIGAVLRLRGVVFVVLLFPFQFPVWFVFFFLPSTYSIIGRIISINRIITHHPPPTTLVYCG